MHEVSTQADCEIPDSEVLRQLHKEVFSVEIRFFENNSTSDTTPCKPAWHNKESFNEMVSELEEVMATVSE